MAQEAKSSPTSNWRFLELEPGVSQAEVQAESERAQLKLPLRKAPQPAKHPGRQELPAHLPRVEKIIACTPEQCICFQWEVLQVWRFDLISWADAPRPIDFRTVQVAPV